MPSYCPTNPASLPTRAKAGRLGSCLNRALESVLRRTTGCQAPRMSPNDHSVRLFSNTVCLPSQDREVLKSFGPGELPCFEPHHGQHRTRSPRDVPVICTVFDPNEGCCLRTRALSSSTRRATRPLAQPAEHVFMPQPYTFPRTSWASATATCLYQQVYVPESKTTGTMQHINCAFRSPHTIPPAPHRFRR